MIAKTACAAIGTLTCVAPLFGQLTPPTTGECIVADPTGKTVGCTSSKPLNPLFLSNGADTTGFINDPFVGADPESLSLPLTAAYTERDYYWKVFPAGALQRCSGLTELWGLELTVYDQDFAAGEVLYGYAISEGVSNGGLIEPDFANTAVVVPGLSAPSIFGSPVVGCPPDTLPGWRYTETFEDLAGNEVELVTLLADGEQDWVFTHFFPGSDANTTSSLSSPVSNGCGLPGDATLQWALSTDAADPSNAGENLPDWLGQGSSPYGGYNSGPGVDQAPLLLDQSSDVAWLFDEPVLQLNVDTDNGDGFHGPEMGLAGLHTALQISSSSVPGSGTTRFGVVVHDGTADPGLSGLVVPIVAANLFPNHLDTGIGCLPFFGSTTAMNAGDPAFLPVLESLSFQRFWPDAERPHTQLSTSPLLTAGVGAAWHDLSLSWQAHTLDLITVQVTGSTNVFHNTFQFNDGL